MTASRLINRNVVAERGRTSMRLEPELWEMLTEICEREAQDMSTLVRTVRTATVNDWTALAWSRETGLVQSVERPGMEILDRVGGGDSFASGLIYGLMTNDDLAGAVEIGAAHGALAMTTPGDTSSATLAEVLALVSGAGARVQR